MARRRKVNLPLIEVIMVSLLVHVGGLMILGGITIWTAMQPEEPEMEAPPPPQQVEQQQVQRKVRLNQTQKKSTRPRAKIAVQNIAQINLPSLDLNMPTVDTRVAVGVGGAVGGGSLNRSFGSGGVDFSKSAVNFFGIKSEGERVMFLVDASRYMLEDKKGGIPAYHIIKEEISKMISGLQPGTLFNILFFDGGKAMIFSPKMQPATTENKERVAKWMDPINATGDKLGISSNISIKNTDIKPLTKDVSNWVRAIQISMEQGCDAIFLITPTWQWQGRSFESTEARVAWQKKQGWSDAKQVKWDEAVKIAQQWLKDENARRKAKGMEPKVVVWIGTVVEDLKKQGKIDKSVGAPPALSYSRDDIIEHITQLSRTLYKDNDKSRPPVNIVLFLGADENPETNSSVPAFKEVARKNRGGKFRVLEGEADLMKTVGRS